MGTDVSKAGTEAITLHDNVSMVGGGVSTASGLGEGGHDADADVSTQFAELSDPRGGQSSISKRQRR